MGCCCCCCRSTVEGTILSEAGDVLPTLLERFLTSADHRIGFEKSLEGTNGEIVLQVFKPLLYFELACFKDAKSAIPLADLFKKLYLIPHQEELLNGFAANLFKEFLECEEPTVAEYSRLRTGLDTQLTLEYLLPYQRDNKIELVEGVSSAVAGNQLVKVDDNYEAVFEKREEEEEEEVDEPPEVPPRIPAKLGLGAIKRFMPSLNFKKLAFGNGSLNIPSKGGGGNSRISWMGMMSMRNINADFNFSSRDQKFMAPPPGLQNTGTKKNNNSQDSWLGFKDIFLWMGGIINKSIKLKENVMNKDMNDITEADNILEQLKTPPEEQKQRKSSLYLLPKSKGQNKKTGFREIRSGFDLNEVKKEDVLYFLKYAREDNEKTTEDIERAIGNLSEDAADLLGEDIDWIFDFMQIADIPADTIIFRQDEYCPYFFVTLSGAFTLGDEHCTETNISSLYTIDDTSGEFKCKESGVLWFMSRLDYQKLKVEQLKSKITQGESLLNNITEIPGLKDLPREQIEQLASSLKPLSFKSGDIIIEKGLHGSSMYFIQKGTAIVTMDSIANIRNKSVVRFQQDTKMHCGRVSIEGISDAANKVTIIARRGPGEYIGEGALLESLGSQTSSGTRNATVVAFDNVECLALERKDFETHMGSLQELFEHNFVVKILRTIPILKSVPESQLFTMSTRLQQRIYEPGTHVVSQGDPGNEFFIIKEGTLDCTLKTEDETTVSVGSLISGDYFGEGALLTQEPRRCNVVVVGNKEATLWVLSKSNFDSCIPAQILNSLVETFDKRSKADTQDNSKNLKLDDFDTIKTLGSGSYGTVELIRHRVTGQTYALKQIRKATVLAKKQQKFVQNERQLLSKMSSKFVVNLIQTFKDEESVYLLSEVCLGGELYQFMKISVENRLKDAGYEDCNNLIDDDDEVFGCFEIYTQARFFIACIILAVEFIHSKGIVHRDIKPENIMLTNIGYIKLVDFGFAKEIFSQRTYSLCGTPEYTAPEVFKRIGHNKQVDFWATGVILYEMASGFSPFHIESQNSWDCYQEIARYEKYHPRIQFPATFDDNLQKLALKLMHPNPLKRYGSLKITSVELKEHQFFKQNDEHPPIDWDSIKKQTYRLPEEYCPPCPEYGLDVRNFTDCQDKHLKDHEKVPDEIVKNDTSGWDRDF